MGGGAQVRRSEPVDDAESSERSLRWPDVLLAVALAVVALGPLLLDRGVILVGDMVFVPDQPWKDAWTGGDGGVPRAVPGDAWVSLLDSLVPGALLQRLVLLATLVGAALGMSRLTAQLSFPARAAGAVLFVWNPYVFERLAIGHWALLCGYAALPWVLWAALQLRAPRARLRTWAHLLLPLAVAGWASPTGGVLALLVVLVFTVNRPRRAMGVVLLGVWVNLPWIVPAFGNGVDQLPPDAFGVTAFATRSDSPWGVFGSAFTFGGIWKESIFPDDRASIWLSSVSMVIVVAALWGLVARPRLVLPVLPVLPAFLLGGGALLVALLGALEPTRPLLEWAVLHVPGGGLLRDGQKWLAPWVLVSCVGFAVTVERLRELSARRAPQSRNWVVSLALLPVMALPSFAFGLGGFLAADEFPEQWFDLRHEMEQLDLADDLMVVLPFSTYRRFDWTPRTVLDPAPRFFPGRMVTEDALTTREGTVGGESALASRVREATDDEELAQVLSQGGVRWALVHRSSDIGPMPAGSSVVVEGDQLSLLELRTPEAEPAYAGDWRPTAYVLLDLVVLGSVVVLACSAWWARGRAVCYRRVPCK